MTKTSAEIAAEMNLPVESNTGLLTGQCGIALEYNGEEIRVAFTDGRKLWIHRMYLDLVALAAVSPELSRVIDEATEAGLID